MILMIDNYDSFTYNLVQYFGELGADLVVFRNDKILIDQIEKLNPEKIVISPGPCTPNEAGISCQVIKHYAGRVPILGVCLGHQCIGQVFGGNIYLWNKLKSHVLDDKIRTISDITIQNVPFQIIGPNMIHFLMKK